jgi:hypothetical protein
VLGGKWSVPVKYGDPGDAGAEFEIAALIVRKPTHDLWLDRLARFQEGGLFAPLRLPEAGLTIAEAYRRVRRG